MRSPARVSVFPPSSNDPEVRVRFPVTDTAPVRDIVPAMSRLPNDPAEMELAAPVIFILPLPVLVCDTVPETFPPTVNVLPPSANVPVVNARLPVIVLAKAAGRFTPAALLMVRLAGPLEAGNSFTLAV